MSEASWVPGMIKVGELRLSDLDRCEHGRHSVDDCVSCPGGWSTGNLFLPCRQDTAVRIGTDHGDNPIMAVPMRSLRDGSDHPHLHDPTHGRIDRDIQKKVDDWGPADLAQRVAVENTLQEERNRRQPGQQSCP